MSSTNKRFIINPKTGMQETNPDYLPPDPTILELLRKEVKQMIEGNVQFHEDPYSESIPIVVEEEDEAFDSIELLIKHYTP